MRNVLKCSTGHTFFTVKFWHFSSAAFIEKKRRTGTYASNNNNNNNHLSVVTHTYKTQSKKWGQKCGREISGGLIFPDLTVTYVYRRAYQPRNDTMRNGQACRRRVDTTMWQAYRFVSPLRRRRFVLAHKADVRPQLSFYQARHICLRCSRERLLYDTSVASPLTAVRYSARRRPTRQSAGFGRQSFRCHCSAPRGVTLVSAPTKRCGSAGERASERAGGLTDRLAGSATTNRGRRWQFWDGSRPDDIGCIRWSYSHRAGRLLANGRQPLSQHRIMCRPAYLHVMVMDFCPQIRSQYACPRTCWWVNNS